MPSNGLLVLMTARICYTGFRSEHTAGNVASACMYLTGVLMVGSAPATVAMLNLEVLLLSMQAVGYAATACVCLLGAQFHGQLLLQHTTDIVVAANADCR